MSDEVVSPYTPTTTPTIERANRLISLRAHPGFLELLRLSQILVDSTTATLVDYGGWDAQQIMVLKVRAQAAKEHHDLLLAKINEAIREGVAEAATMLDLPEKSVADIVDQGDFVRQQVLTTFNDMDESRMAGSY